MRNPNFRTRLERDLGVAALDPETFTDDEREALESARYVLAGVDLDTLPDGVLDPLTGHPFGHDSEA